MSVYKSIWNRCLPLSLGDLNISKDQFISSIFYLLIQVPVVEVTGFILMSQCENSASVQSVFTLQAVQPNPSKHLGLSGIWLQSGASCEHPVKCKKPK